MYAIVPSLLTCPAPALSSGLITFATRSFASSALTLCWIGCW